MNPIAEAIDSYVDHLRLERRLSRATVSAYRSDLLQHLEYLGGRGIAQVDRVGGQDLREDLARLHESGRSRSSIQRYRSSLRGFYCHLLREGWILADPAAELEASAAGRRLPRPLSKEEIERLLSTTGGSDPLCVRDRALIELAYGAGLRVSELVGVGAEDVDIENRWVRVRGKGRRERIVPFAAAVGDAVRTYVRGARAALLSGKKSSRLFVNRAGGPLSRMGFFRVLRKRALAAGLDASSIHPHLLRHSFATHMLQNGVSLRFIQELLGHRSLTTTEIYTAVDDGFLRSVHRRHHPRGKAVFGKGRGT